MPPKISEHASFEGGKAWEGNAEGTGRPLPSKQDIINKIAESINYLIIIPTSLKIYFAFVEPQQMTWAM